MTGRVQPALARRKKAARKERSKGAALLLLRWFPHLEPGAVCASAFEHLDREPPSLDQQVREHEEGVPALGVPAGPKLPGGERREQLPHDLRKGPRLLPNLSRRAKEQGTLPLECGLRRPQGFLQGEAGYLL